MRNDAFKITLATGAAAVFGMFLRWLQRLSAFETVTGLVTKGAATSVLLVLYLLAALLCFAALGWYLKRHFAAPVEPEQALGSQSSLPLLLLRVAAAVLGLSGVVLMFSAHTQPHPLLSRLLAAGVLALAGCLLMAFAGAERKSFERNPLSLVPVCFCCLWLLCQYRFHAEDPVLWGFVVEILAIVANTLACYELGAYAYGRAKPERALFFAQAAVLLDVTTLVDEHRLAAKVLFAVFAGCLLLCAQLLMSNLRPKDEHE